jgi:chromosome segregation protein
VRARLDSDEFDETTWAHLEAMIAEYDTLSDDIRAEYQAHSQAILDEIYGTQEAKPHTDYETQLAEHRATLESNQAARTKLESCEAELLAQLDDARAQQSNPAQARQELQIKRLKLEQALSNTQYEVQEINRSITDLEQQLGEYQAEESQARELLGREVDEILARASNTDTVDPQLREEIIQTRTLLAHAGAVGGEEIIEEYNSKKKEAEYIAEQLADLEASVARLQELITELDTKLEEKFRAGLEQINRSFDAFFKTLFSGGSAELREVQVPVRNEEEEHELGIEMHVSLPNKKIGSLDVLSGGERSLTSIALLFAMSQVAPPPFIILDETDAALDEANSKRYGDMIEELAKHSQLILITHNRETMSRAGVLYGVTMGDDGVSRLLSVSLEEASAVAK